MSVSHENLLMPVHLPLITIIIVNYNGRGLLQSCLESVYSQPYADIEVIVVDNGSCDGSIEHVRENFLRALLLPLSENRGFASANNEGLRHARGQFIMLLNNDVVVERDCISGLVAAMEGDTAVGICAAKMLVYGKDIIDSAGDGFSSNLKGFKRGEGRPSAEYDKAEYIFGACAGAALYRREMLDEIGFMDEDFFLIFEDTDLNLRAQLAGWKVRYVPGAVVHHKVRSTIGNMSDTAIFYSLRNSELVRIKNIPLMLFLRCLPTYVVGTILEFLYFSIKHGKLKLYCKAKFDVIKKLRIMMGKRRKIMGMKKVNSKYLSRLMTPVCNREFFLIKVRKFFQG